MGLADRVIGKIDFPVANEDASRGRLEDAGQGLDQGRLAGAVVADKADGLVAADREIDILQRLNRAEIFLHILETHDMGVIARRFRRGERGHAQPPSTVNSWALHMRASSDARNRTMRARSTGMTRPFRHCE